MHVCARLHAGTMRDVGFAKSVRRALESCGIASATLTVVRLLGLQLYAKRS